MKIVLTTLDGNIYPIEVSEELELINLKALCEQEVNIPAAEISLSHNGQPLTDDYKTLAGYSIKENDILVVQKMMTNPTRSASAAGASTSSASNNIPLIDFGSIQVPQSRPTSSRSNNNLPNMENIRQMLMSDPVQFEMVRQRFPELANAIQKNDTPKVLELMGKLASRDQQQLVNPISIQGNYMDMENQKKIAEAIRLQNIQQNMESALEHMPEVFGNVVMLYIDCVVNGHHVKAFVDSGAQMTIMSAACAERCGIMRLVDTRWAGIAKGVGTQKIVGRVHLAQIMIEKSFLTTAFSILEEQPMDMLLGLDLLKRHQCIIDLERNCLVIKSANIETKFLPESELPYFARLNQSEQIDEPELKTIESTNGNNKATTSSTSKLPTNISESAVNNLCKLGFDRKDVIEALSSTNGDENGAKVILIAKSFKAP